jgi:hypothetical protein
MENIKNIISVKRKTIMKRTYPVINDKVTREDIIRLITKYSEKEKYELDKEVEVVIPGMDKVNYFESSDNTVVVSNDIKFDIKNDFDTYTGKPYTTQAEKYLSNFNRIYARCKVEGVEEPMLFAIWYRNFYAE